MELGKKKSEDAPSDAEVPENEVPLQAAIDHEDEPFTSQDGPTNEANVIPLQSISPSIQADPQKES